MPRSIWKGAISFGLVNIPVEVFPATRDTSVHFHQLHRDDIGRVRYKKVCSIDDKELTSDDIVRGYEVGRDEYVIVEDEELRELAPDKSDTIEIFEFVELASIDPLFFERPYYLAPERNGARPYHLLRAAMEKEQRVAIASFVLRQRGYLVAIRPLSNALVMETMHFLPEIVAVEEIGKLGEAVELPTKELKLAQQLIGSLAGAFEPERYHNEYDDRVHALIEAKANDQEYISEAPVVHRRQKALDLKEALQQSLKEASSRERAKALPKQSASKPRPAAKKPAAKKPAAKKPVATRASRKPVRKAAAK